MGALTMYALFEREKRRAARVASPKRELPAAASPSATSPPADRGGLVRWDESGAYYVVQPGDYGAKIAALFPGADVPSLVKANPQIREWRTVQPGTRLRVPDEWISTKPAGSHAIQDL